MTLNVFCCVLNDWCLDYNTKEKWFLEKVSNCKQKLLMDEATTCYTFSVVERKTNIPFIGQALFVNQRLKGLELEIDNSSRTGILKDAVTGMLGEPDIRMKDKSYYFFENTKYTLMQEEQVLLIEFHKTYKKSRIHFDNPFQLFRVYRLRGLTRYLGLATLLFTSFMYSYNVCQSICGWLETGYEFYFKGSITGSIFVLPFILWTIRNILGLYNMEYSRMGKTLKYFCDGTDKGCFNRYLNLLNKELKDVELKDINIRITRNFVCIRDIPLCRFVAIPRKNIVNVSYGILTMKNKVGTVTHTCLDIKAADGNIYKYTSRKKGRMEAIKAMIS